jgi:hypothetical protein
MKSPKSPVSDKIAVPTSPRCNFSYSDGRRCRMLCRPPHLSLCPFHAREELQILEAGKIAASFASITGGFYTFNDVNQALGTLFRVVAANRIPPRSAVTLAYLGQLLLQSIPGVEREVNLSRGKDGWRDLLTFVLNPRSKPKDGLVQ